GKSESSSMSHSYSERSLLTPDELMRMNPKEAILLVSGMYGVKLRKAYQFEIFKGILNERFKSSRFNYFELVGREREQKMTFEHQSVSIEERMKALDIDMEELTKEIVNKIDHAKIEIQPLQTETKEKEQKKSKRKRKRKRKRQKHSEQKGKNLSVDLES